MLGQTRAPGRRIRVLYVESGESGTGGSFESLVQMIRCLDRDRVEPVAVLLNDSWCLQALRELGVPCWRESAHLYARERCNGPAIQALFIAALAFDKLPWPPLAPLWDLAIHWPLVARIRRILRRHRIDLLHTNTMVHRDFFALWAARLEGIPAVSHLRSYFSGRFPAKAAWANRWVSRYVTISQGVRDHWAGMGVDPARVTVLHNAIFPEETRPLDLAREWGLALNGPLIGGLGRMTVGRHFQWLIRGFEKVLQAHPTSRLVILGDGPRHREFSELSRDLGLAERVLLPGYDPRGKEFLAAVDVYVGCRYSDPFGRDLLEAWLVGTPAVVARHEPLEGLIRHEENVLLYEPGDVEDLARQVARVLSDPELARRLVHNGRQAVRERFDPATFRRGLMQVYEGALGQRRTRGA